MFGIHSNKRKLLLLGVGALIMILIMYKMAISKTIERAQLCKTTEEALTNIDETNRQFQVLQNNIDDIQEIIFSENEDSWNIRQMILEASSKFCSGRNITLNSITEPINQFEDEYVIQTNIISTQGSFHDQLSLIYMFERKLQVARVVSVDMYLKKDRRTRLDYLHMDLFVQNIKPQTP
jgi:DNA gyrase/topoisomerase IV subunit A